MITIYDDIDLYDAEELLEFIEIGKIVILRNDPKISMVNGGNTMYYIEDGEYKFFCQGQNWRDQEATTITKERLLEHLDDAIKNVEADFEKYEYDTIDTNCSYITIMEGVEQE